MAAADDAGQCANIIAAVDINVDQAHPMNQGGVIGLPQLAEQADHAIVGIGVVDIEVGNSMPVALKLGRVGGNTPQSPIHLGGQPDGETAGHPMANRHPAPPAVPVGPAVVVGVHIPVPVAVKVQVGQQFVANAPGSRAAHPGHRVLESPGSPGISGGDGRLLRNRLHSRVRGIAVAVHVIAHRVQLRQGGYVNQPVIVPVIVGGSAARNRNPVGFGRRRSINGCING